MLSNQISRAYVRYWWLIAIFLFGIVAVLVINNDIWNSRVALPVQPLQIPANVCRADGQPIIYRLDLRSPNELQLVYLNQAGQMVAQLFYRENSRAAWQLYSEAVLEGAVCLSGPITNGVG